MYVSDEQFWAYYKSDTWHQKRAQSIAAWRSRCYVCGDDYRVRGERLQVNHVRYRNSSGKIIHGHEDPVRDLVPLCESHHRPGTMDWNQVRSWRSYYRTYKVTKWLVALPWRLLRWLVRQTVIRLCRRLLARS